MCVLVYRIIIPRIIFIITNLTKLSTSSAKDWMFLFVFLVLDFCRFCVVIRFFHPRHNGQWPPTLKDFLSQILSTAFIFLS